MALGPITALGYIKLGDKNIPIFQHDTFGGNPTSTNTGRPSLPNIHYAIDDLWASSEEVGNGVSTNNNPMSTSAIIGQGTTPLHDSAEVVFTISDSTESAGTLYIGTALIRYQDGETAVQINTSSQQVVGPQKSGSNNASRVRSMRYYARTYSYPEADEDAWKVKGYLIYAVQRDQVLSKSGSVSNTYAALTDPYIINLPNINRKSGLYTYLDEQEEPSDPNTEDPDYPSEPSEPDPDHTITVNPIPIPNLPSMGSATAGFLTMYKLGLSAINQFASDMFASSVWEAIKLFFGNPMDFLVGCMLLPFEPSTGSSYYPKFGLVTFEHAYPAVDNQYKEIDCGYVDIKKFWGSCFDYEPFTKLQIWLPYIGYRDIPTDEFMGEQLHVVYHCDCLTGDCVAFITTTSFLPGEQAGPSIPRVLAQYYGNCGVRVPFSSVNFDAAVAAGINLIGAAASMGLSKGIGGVASHEASKANGGVSSMSVDEGYSEPSGSGLAGATINMVESMKPTVQKGGAAGASNGYMSIQKPYLIKRIPRQSLPENYVTLKGYPSNIGGTLSQFSGYAEVENIQLNNIPAMEGERKEIMNWLAGGVII